MINRNGSLGRQDIGFRNPTGRIREASGAEIEPFGTAPFHPTIRHFARRLDNESSCLGVARQHDLKLTAQQCRLLRPEYTAVA